MRIGMLNSCSNGIGYRKDVSVPTTAAEHAVAHVLGMCMRAYGHQTLLLRSTPGELPCSALLYTCCCTHGMRGPPHTAPSGDYRYGSRSQPTNIVMFSRWNAATQQPST